MFFREWNHCQLSLLSRSAEFKKPGITLGWVLENRITFEPESLFPWYNPDLPRSRNPDIE
jgi:hypothetical protein